MRQKTLTDDLVCPITLELPFDPDTAEDGRVYERSAIEQHIKGKSSEELKSPITGSQMGNRLLPAVQHKNHIQSMIETGVITGDLAENWRKKAEQKKKMGELIKEAEDGNAKAMEELGLKYKEGSNGFPKDLKLAYTWSKKAHESGMVKGTARMTRALLYGDGVKRCPKDGIVFMSMAAAQGSDFASYKLGVAFADGMYGLSANKPEAISWLQMIVSGECSVKHLSDSGKQKARVKLDELIAEIA